MIPNKDRAPHPGDLLEAVSTWTGAKGHLEGETYVFERWNNNNSQWELRSRTGSIVACCDLEQHFKFKESTMATESIATTMVNLTDNQKALKELGLLNDNLTLNTEGAAALREFLRNKYESEFVSAVQATQPNAETKPTT